MSEKEIKLEGFPIKEFDPSEKGEIAVDPETNESIRDTEPRKCIGMYFPYGCYPANRNKAGYWGGCTMIAWRYPAGNYIKPDGSILKWGGGHSPFKRT